jgi:hypothetical protein
LLAALAVASVWPVASALAASGKVSVRPSVGSPRTAFAVSFTAQRTGFIPSGVGNYRVLASTRASRGCVSAVAVTVPATWQGQHVRVSLRPGRPSGVWCKGSYAGRLEETLRPTCGFRVLCPSERPAIQTWIGYLIVGRFSFRVL